MEASTSKQADTHFNLVVATKMIVAQGPGAHLRIFYFVPYKCTRYNNNNNYYYYY